MKYDVIREAPSGAPKGARQPQADEASIIVIGYGNLYRRDDGAGLLLAEKLADTWSCQGIGVRAITATQLLPEMAAEIAPCEVEAVIFVDTEAIETGAVETGAVETGAVEGDCGVNRTLRVAPVELDNSSLGLGHHFDPATLLLYAALLYGRYPRAWLVTIPGVDFAHGPGVSEGVSRLLENVAPLAEQLFNEIQKGDSCTN
jgi:hydrogenase maturation protease